MIIPTASTPLTLPDGPTFGLDPNRNAHLIAKLRAMDPQLRATIIGEQEQA